MSAGQTVRLVGDTQRAFAHRLLDKAPAGAIVNVREATRSSAQNALMQVLLSDVARSKPGGRVLRADQWKCLFMDALAEESRNASFASRWVPSLDGDGVVNIGFRSSRLATNEMGELIDFIIVWGTQHGVRWSEQTERTA